MFLMWHPQSEQSKVIDCIHGKMDTLVIGEVAIKLKEKAITQF